MEINRHYRDYTRKDQQADIQARRSVPDESIQIAVAYESYLEPEQELNFEGTNNHNTQINTWCRNSNHSIFNNTINTNNNSGISGLLDS